MPSVVKNLIIAIAVFSIFLGAPKFEDEITVEGPEIVTDTK